MHSIKRPTGSSGSTLCSSGASTPRHVQVGDGGVAETEVQRHLFVGNHSAAVEACLAAERYADALVLAHVSGSAPLWSTALSRYMAACPHPYLRVVDSQVCAGFASWSEVCVMLTMHLIAHEYGAWASWASPSACEHGLGLAVAVHVGTCAGRCVCIACWFCLSSSSRDQMVRCY